MRRKLSVLGIFMLLCAAASTNGQAPSPQWTAEQVATAKAELTKQATMAELLRRASSCEAGMLDLSTLKARVVELEAIQKASEGQKAPDMPVSPKKPS